MPKQKFLSVQSGVAVVTAMLLTTLAITIVASLFWQQQIQVRTIENQRLQLQKKWILRGAIDWSRLILREDARQSGNVDHLGEPWAIGLAETRLDQFVENARSDPEASKVVLSGQIDDAQAKFNLNVLASGGEPDPKEVDAFTRLLSIVGVRTDLSIRIAQMVADTQIKATVQDPRNPNKSGAAQSEIQFLGLRRLEDILTIPDVNLDVINKLRNFVTVLPERTDININTAPAEVLAARVPGFDLSSAKRAVLERQRAYFLNPQDIYQRIGMQVKEENLDLKRLSVKTQYFIVRGLVKMEPTSLDVQALIERKNDRTTVLWMLEK